MAKRISFVCKGYELGNLKKLSLVWIYGREVEPLEKEDFCRN